ncbi:protein MIZU-KUSSEI 1-like [Solanum pennellii]|uniref:Protein MIZU-KUSSEI 1-like n=1 Tax=Solanum pennellii TaxID=28526 RepID=A0ABM1FDL3_SOLPN|nr:protein MIZU-KUSSEI 1-like [Solanum pennellii]
MMMMRQYDQTCTLPRTSSSDSANNLILIASEYQSNSIVHHDSNNYLYNSPIPQKSRGRVKVNFKFFKFLLVKIISLRTMFPTCCTWLKYFPTTYLTHYNSCRKVTGTLFGHRRGQVSFAIQDNSTSSEPSFLIELAMSTTTLVKDMSSPLVRIALECEKRPRGSKQVKLSREPSWNMYCNGRKCGDALARACTDSDRHVLHTVRNVSVGAGVIPVVGDGRMGGELEGELMFFRANFERVIGNRDSEAFYMTNLDGIGGSELSIFLLRT